MEEHAVASALQGVHMSSSSEPEPGRKPSAEEEKDSNPFQLGKDSKPSADEVDKKRSSASAEQEASEECVICMDQQNSHIMVPCGHQCVCQSCADRITEDGETCPICRAAVTMTIAVYK